MNRIHAVVIAGIAIVSVAITISLYYFFMPAWLLIERIESTEHNVIVLTDSAIEASPKLKEALETTDERYDPRFAVTNPFKLTSSEGREILDIIQEYDSADSADSSNRFRIENDDKYYLVNVLFRYEPPPLA